MTKPGVKFSYFKVHALSITLYCLSSDSQMFPLAFPPPGPRSQSDSESEYSASNSEDDDGVAQECEEDTDEVTMSQKSPSQNKAMSAPVCKETPSKKMKRDKTVSGDFNLKEKLCTILKLSYPKEIHLGDQHNFFFFTSVFLVFPISMPVCIVSVSELSVLPVCIHNHVSMPHAKGDISVQLYKNELLNKF